MTPELYAVYTQHFNHRYRGVPCWKSPFDLTVMQMLISDLRPDLIVEIGSHAGGSALCYADLCSAIGHGKVHAVDVHDNLHPLAKAHPRITASFDGWQAINLVNLQRVLVIDDSSHTYDNTLGILRHFSPMLPPGSFIVVEDGIIEELGVSHAYGGGPLQAIRDHLVADPSLSFAPEYGEFWGPGVSHHPMGYLRKS